MRYRSLELLCMGVSSLTALACGGNQKQAEAPEPAAVTATEEKDEEAPEAPAEDVVAQAAAPFTGYRKSDGAQLTEDELFTYLAQADAICVGERHDNPADHYAQLRSIEALAERRAMRNFEFGVGLEMVRRDAQRPLLKYQNGEIDRAAFLEESGWEQEWGFPIQFYDPLFRAATQVGAPLLALGVDRKLTRQVASEGLDSLSADVAARLPELNLEDEEHRKVFDSLMAGHPGLDESQVENYYAAQVIWDEAMADKTTSYVQELRPLRKVLIFAGVAHCHKNAIPARIQRRSGLNVANLIVADGKPVKAKEGSDDAEQLLYQGYDYQLVFAR